ncbi:MAG: Rieske 2Fe-2S domain-containing protein, partial [Euzebyales bacterium]|nr:Rieske 2Fe-2S domain-containing protein [Euzebyales bacterium]
GNTVALGLQLASLVARRRGHRGLGKALSLGALGLVGGSGYLGGHLSYVLGVGVDHTAFHHGPEDWTSTGVAANAVSAAAPTAAEAGDRTLFLVAVDGDIVAYDATCTHAGGPLAEGEIVDGCVRCPWHDSMFALADGSVVQAPATTPVPRYEVRLSGGVVEVRATT